LGEQWIKDGLGRPATSGALDSADSMPPEAFDGAEPLSRLLDSELSPVPSTLAKTTNRPRTTVLSRL
ncbi:LysR family transcriptional regulator, partial [Cupriavidus sp. SIMBA_020]